LGKGLIMKKLIFFTLLFCLVGLTQQPAVCMEAKRQKVEKEDKFSILPYDCLIEILKYVEENKTIQVALSVMRVNQSGFFSVQNIKGLAVLNITLNTDNIARMVENIDCVKECRFLQGNKMIFTITIFGMNFVSLCDRLRRERRTESLFDLFKIFKDLNIETVYLTPFTAFRNVNKEVYPGQITNRLDDMFDLEKIKNFYLMEAEETIGDYAFDTGYRKITITQKDLESLKKMKNLEKLVIALLRDRTSPGVPGAEHVMLTRLPQFKNLKKLRFMRLNQLLNIHNEYLDELRLHATTLGTKPLFEWLLPRKIKHLAINRWLCPTLSYVKSRASISKLTLRNVFPYRNPEETEAEHQRRGLEFARTLSEINGLVELELINCLFLSEEVLKTISKAKDLKKLTVILNKPCTHSAIERFYEAKKPNYNVYLKTLAKVLDSISKKKKVIYILKGKKETE